jgi:DNA-binding XRE family transcriptional regulator
MNFPLTFVLTTFINNENKNKDNMKTQTTKSTVHENLKRSRRAKNFTQEYMAEKLHKSQSAYSAMENGSSKIDADLLPKICSILNCTIDDLYENTGEKPE